MHRPASVGQHHDGGQDAASCIHQAGGLQQSPPVGLALVGTDHQHRRTGTQQWPIQERAGAVMPRGDQGDH